MKNIMAKTFASKYKKICNFEEKYFAKNPLKVQMQRKKSCYLSPTMSFANEFRGNCEVAKMRIGHICYQRFQHTAPEWCQPEKFATLSFSAFLVICDQDKKLQVGQQIL